jgi:hypothetical protein
MKFLSHITFAPLFRVTMIRSPWDDLPCVFPSMYSGGLEDRAPMTERLESRLIYGRRGVGLFVQIRWCDWPLPLSNLEKSWR